MKLRIPTLLCACACTFAMAQAQQVTISPIPQQVEWGSKAFDSKGAIFTLKGAAQADVDAVNALSKACQVGEGGIEILIGERGDDAVASVVSNIPTKTEGYYLKVTPSQVIIAGHDQEGTFYGVQSFLQILQSPEVMACEIVDYPDVPDRGVIEGYYGNEWSKQDRISQFEFYAANKMNTYIYGPKDDPYHRGRWREPYPTDQANALKELVDVAKVNKVNFVWALHPGNDIKWNKTDSLNVVNKLELMYDLGLRAFAIFFDDISGEGAKGEKQAGLMNYVTENFVNKHDDVDHLILCPTEYNRAWSGGSYLPALRNNMNKNVRVMWTGNSVVDMINKSDMDWINNQIGSKAYIWLNYPVTDYCINHMLMGPTFGNDNNIGDMLSGFCSNPMEYAEASKVSLYSIADYSWNLEAYDANSSWERAKEYLMPKYLEAFNVFCENNVDLGSNYHGLRRMEGESPTFRAAKAAFEAATADGYNAEAYANIKTEFTRLVNAADVLLNARTDEEVNTALLKEIAPWCEVMKIIGQRGENVVDMMAAYETGDTLKFIELYQANLQLEQTQKNVRSRDFAGSKKTPNPVVADVVIGPFVKKLSGMAVGLYRKTYKYGVEVFPNILLEDGNYYIKWNGKYLNNSGAGNPTFSSSVLDNINPQRMEWTITMDYETQRYKIVNTYDSRVLNELGSFSVNPYEAIWHTYNIYRSNGKYAIQNAGSAGNKFWQVSGSRIQPSDKQKIENNDAFYFEIIPVGGELDSPTFDESAVYYIINQHNRCLTNSSPDPKKSGDRPYFFGKYTNDDALKQGWKILYDSTVKRYKVVSAADNRFVNEKGTFTPNAETNPYDATWNTYIITDLGGKVSVQNAGEAGEKFWSATITKLENNGTDLTSSYLFTIIPHSSMTPVNEIAQDEMNITYDGTYVTVSGSDKIQKISVFALDGTLLTEQAGHGKLSVTNFKGQGVVLVLIHTDQYIKTYKVAL